MGLLKSKIQDQYIVYIEGNIGVGKSTLLNMLESSGFVVMREPVERWIDCEGINFLELYCSDMGKWAFTFQILTLFSVWEEQLKAAKSSDKIIIMERSVHSVINMFCVNQLKSGFLMKEQFLVLNKIAQSLLKLINRKELFIYLRACPSIAYERAQVRSRKEEFVIPKEYFEKLHEALERWIYQEQNLLAVVDCVVCPELVYDRVMLILTSLEEGKFEEE